MSGQWDGQGQGQSQVMDRGHGQPSQEDDNPSEELLQALQTFLAPLKEGILSGIPSPKSPSEGQYQGQGHIVPLSLLQSLSHFIWDLNLLTAQKGFLRRTTATLSTTIFNISSPQSDLQDWFDYKPIELLTLKASQLVLLLALPDPVLFLQEFVNFTGLLQDPRIVRETVVEGAFSWLGSVLRRIFDLLGHQGHEGHEPVPFHDLPPPSQAVIHGGSVIFIKLFKSRSPEKVRRMERLLSQDGSGSVEWALILGEIFRLRRRDSGARNKWASPEEMALLEGALATSPESPYVRLAVLDTIIGVVRDSSGRFHCGDIHLESMEDSMRYLHENCLKLTEDFPNNVQVLSVVSDYFARYFPHLYFDPDRALGLLEAAYKLNPTNPKTTHRFGIIYRMSYGNVEESLKWLRKTLELDLTHYQATLEYYKTLLGKGGDVETDIAGMMESTLTSPEAAAASGWNDYEMSDFLFYLGIAHFIQGHPDKTLEWWRKGAEFGESIFTLEDMLTTSENFQWDQKLVNIDKIKIWIQGVKNSSAGDSGDPGKKAFVSRLFSIMLGFTIPKRAKSREVWERRLPPQVSNYFGVEP